MTKKPFSINRTIHLARRDAFFDRAIELLNQPFGDLDNPTRLKLTEIILQLLKTAETHAFFATRAGAMPRESDLLRLLKLIAHNVQSLHSMLQQQADLESDEGFLCQLLGTTCEQCFLPAMQYARRADDILEGVCQILQLTHSTYRGMMQAARDSMSPEEQERYKHAYNCFRQEVTSKYSPPQRPVAGAAGPH